MNYAQIRSMDITNGNGIGVALFVQGCEFHCKGCFNSKTWNFDGGKPFTEETIDKIIKLAKPDYITRLSILGGEPLHPKNIDDVGLLTYRFRQQYPNKSIWLWTGYTLEELEKRCIDANDGIWILSSLKNIDYIIDGRFEKDKKDLSLLYRGSSNQKIYKRIDNTECFGKVYFHFENITEELEKEKNKCQN